MKSVILPVLATLLMLVIPCNCLAQWPQFRGPDGQGHSNAKGVALHWSESNSVTWKTEIPGEGWSSPVISNNQIWLTSSQADGTSLRAIGIDRTSGKILHNVEVLTTDEVGPKHVQNGFASPTPVLEGNRVFVHFGARGTVCLGHRWTDSLEKHIPSIHCATGCSQFTDSVRR